MTRAILPPAAVLLSGCSSAGGSGTGPLGWFDFSAYPLPIIVGIFTASGVLVWVAGTRLSRYVNEISERTGAGKAFLGALLLGGVTSLPEVATTMTSAVAGEPGLAVNNIFGSTSMNVLLLALVADVVDGGRALTALVRQSTLILQGALSILVIAVAAAAVLLPEYAVLGVGVGSFVLFVAAVISFYLVQRFQSIQRWAPVGEEGEGDPTGAARDLEESLEHFAEAVRDVDEPGRAGPRGHLVRAFRLRAAAHRERMRAFELRAAAAAEHGRGPEDDGGGEPESEPERRARRKQERVRRLSTRRVVLYTVLAGAVILLAGFFLSRTGSAIAGRSGLGESFVGFLLVAFATSLPEISTLISSIRMREFSLVFSEIFGTNIFNSTIIFYTDLAYPGGPLLGEVGRFSQVAALLGIVLTAVYVAGLTTRSTHTSVGRLGKDSLVVIVLYAIGVAVLYVLR